MQIMQCMASALHGTDILDAQLVTLGLSHTLNYLTGHKRVRQGTLCRLVELNTLNGVKNACTSMPVGNAWKEGKPLAVHGVVYNPADGKLKVLQAAPVILTARSE